MTMLDHNGHVPNEPDDNWWPDDLLDIRPDSEPVEARPFHLVDLTDLLEHGSTEPEMVPGHVAWLYAGRLTAIQSEPGVGKTWIAIWLALACMNAGGTVVYMDEEGGPDLVAERLKLLGATPSLIAKQLLYIPFPNREWDLADQAAFKQLLADHSPQIAIFDSLPDFLALAGKSEDSAQDVTWWIDRVCGLCRDHHVAQIVLDHLVKPDADAKRRSQSRYSRGSGAKLAKVDATFLVETAQDFDAHTSGALKLWKTKDRRGRLPLPNLASSPVLIDVTVTDSSVELAVRDPEPNTPTAQRHHRPTYLMERISEFIEKTGEKGIKPSGNQIRAAVKGNKTAKDEAMRVLLDEGYVDFESGPNRSILHFTVRPYRQIADTGSDHFMGAGSEDDDL